MLSPVIEEEMRFRGDIGQGRARKSKGDLVPRHPRWAIFIPNEKQGEDDDDPG